MRKKGFSEENIFIAFMIPREKTLNKTSIG
jgi:hypothetical protein